jgi:NitT/TauT family transport system ATP-binding protein
VIDAKLDVSAAADRFRLDGVGYAYGPVEVLRDLTVTVGAGEFVAVVGPSGCGKSTLLGLFSGFLTPTRGTLVVPPDRATRTIYQSGGLFPWRTVRENIDLGLNEQAGGAERARQADALLTMIGLEAFADHYPHQLSGGMRQRVEIARALAGDGASDALLMDEPFSSLDYLTRLRMRQELARVLAVRPRTVVLVTHDIEEAAQLADRIVVLSPRPASVRAVLDLPGPRPRDVTDPVVTEAVRRILHEMGLDGGAAE